MAEKKEEIAEPVKIAPQEILLSWEAPEFVHHQRNVKWYISAGIILLALLGISVYTGDWFFIIILTLASIGTFIYLNTAPKIKHYAISRVGIEIDGVFYPYENLNAFWIIYNEKVKTLNLIFKKKYLPALMILLDDQDPVLIKSILKKSLKELEREEGYTDKLTRILKF
ncbi:MAG: hypothetical protein M1355_01060 [Patescibacteria group bacterium]|nr:hypothetical protein [Patescibacteria group bacterium]MCL5093709.1 hypothetical protein [Patescibacteria group bacterium]